MSELRGYGDKQKTRTIRWLQFLQLSKFSLDNTNNNKKFD